MSVNNATDLKNYVLRELGAPLIRIDVTDDQINDRISEAIAYFNEYYWNGIVKEYFKHEITQLDIDNKYITIPERIWDITRVFSVPNNSRSSTNIFDLQYQLRMNDLRDLTSTSLIYYEQVMEHISLIDMLLNTQKSHNFNRLQGKLTLDLDWTQKTTVGEFLVMECYAALDPVENPRFWNDRLFKKYVAALVKRQWANNIKKYSNMTLPGGVSVDGQLMYDESNGEVQEIENDILNNLAPLEMRIG